MVVYQNQKKEAKSKTQYNEITYKNRIETFRKLGHSLIYLACIHCKKGKCVHIYYGDDSETWRTCDVCYTVEKL